MLRCPVDIPEIEMEPLPLASCLAKTHVGKHGIEAGRTVEAHCRIAGAVAQRLLERMFRVWAPGKEIFPENSWLAPLAHDIGKICPTFQKKLYDKLNDGESWPQLQAVDIKIEETWGYHAAISFAAMKEVSGMEALAWSLGLHHATNISQKPHDCEQFGGKGWADARKKLLNHLKGSHPWPNAASLTESLLLGGLTIISDWIASGDIFSDPQLPWADLVDPALDNAGFVYPEIYENLSFEEIFGFKPNSCQMELANAVNGPGVYILEAPMGMGKTEAALFAAYKLLSSGQACGLYFALPTQLASNMINQRINAFLKRILIKPVKAVLAHSDAWLARWQMQQAGCELSPNGQWFDHGRRAILAPYAVGTVDQALMAAIRVKWAGLRLFGLAGKVVILDEIHSYDEYTGKLVKSLIEHLVSMGSTVVILSATLSQAKRCEFLSGKEKNAMKGESAYPLLTSSLPDKTITARKPEKPASKTVSLKFEKNDELAIEEILDRAASGQQTVWIENTVQMAQDVFRKLAARASGLGIETGLLHSRFIMGDRFKNEAHWTALLGKDGRYGTKNRSDCGRILVGTQVIEQSLDLDADFLVSRFAPADMALQRLGRLWRHERKSRPGNARCEAWLLAPLLVDALENPEKAFADSGSSYVYSPYALARSLEACQNKDKLRLPEDIRALIESASSKREEIAGSPLGNAQIREKKIVDMKIGQALYSLSSIGSLLDEDVAGTRLIENESAKVLLLRDVNQTAGACRLLDDARLDLSGRPAGDERMNIAAKLASQLVKVSVSIAPEKAPKAIQKMFAPFFYDAKKGNMRILLIDRSGASRDPAGREYENISYDSRIGYCYNKF